MPRHGHLSVFWSLPNKIITHQHQEIIIIFSYLTSFYRRSNCLVLLRVTCPPYMEWSPYMRESGIREIFACGIRGILGFGFRNTVKEIQLKKSGIQNPSSTDIKSEASSWNPESLAWSPKSKTVLYSLMWGENGWRNNKRLGAMTRSEHSGI